MQALTRAQSSAGNRAVARLMSARRSPAAAQPVQRLAEGTESRGGAETDPRFAEVKTDIAGAKKKMSAHPPANAEAGKAQAAAKPPPDDKLAQGKAANADRMNAAKPGEFDKAAFVRAVNEAIAAQAPKNLDEADKFGESGKADAVKGQVQGQVGQGRQTTAGPIEQATTAPPDTSAAKEKPVTPLAPDAPPPVPAAPNAANAVPPKAPAAATDFSAGPKQVDGQMAEAGVTEEQLAKSNEPEFTDAVKEKKSAEAHAATAPGQVRAAEAQTLAGAKAQAAGAGTAAMAQLADQRRASGAAVSAGKQGAQSQDEIKRAAVTAKLQKVFDATQRDVEGILSGLDKKVDDAFTAGEKAARDAFTAQHKRRMDAYKDARYSGFSGKLRWVKDKFAGLPDEANQIFVQARKGYVDQMQQVISRVADIIGGELTRAKARIAAGREELQAEVRRLPADLQSIGRQAATDFGGKFDQLTESVDAKGSELVQTLASKYNEALKSVDEEIEAEKEKNKGLVAKAVGAIKGVIDTILNLKNLLLGVLAKAASAIAAIIKDPIGFLGNLVSAVGAGLRAFVANIGEHLKKGLIGWLTGAMAGAGLTMPAKFDLRGIILMIGSLLGLTWASIRGRIVSRGVPEQAMGAVEQSVPLVQKVKSEGIGGIWETIKEKVGDLKANLFGKIAQYLIPTILVAGITWIVSLLNPASAFIRAVKMIIDFVTFIIDRGAQILQFVNAVLDAVIAIAGGGTGGVPALIEGALAASIPVLIGVLAAVLGIGGIAGKVKSFFQSLAKPVMKAVDFVVDKVVKFGKGIWKKLKSGVRGIRDRFGRKGKDGKDGRSDDQKLRDLNAGLDEAHALVKARRSAEAINAKLPGIQRRHRMTALTLVIDERKPGEQVAHVEGAVNPQGRRDKEALPLDKIHAAIAANGGELGETIGQGGFGVVRLVPGMPNLVIKTAIGGGLNPQLEKETEALVFLESKGVPTPYRDRIQWTDGQGATHAGILMDRISGAFSKQVLEIGKFADTVASPADKALLNAQTVSDLIRLRETCVNNSINIEDIQFMITQDGSIRVIDPARIQDLSGLPNKKRRPIMTTFVRRIDRIISQVRQIAGA